MFVDDALQIDPALLGPLFKIFLHTSTATWYWDSQLEDNGVYEQRFAQPYKDSHLA